MAAGLYDIPVNSIDGKPASLADHKGEVMLVVNVASQCGLTPQYAELEEVYESYRDRGLVVLGFPANEFAKQEPGSNAEIKQFCETKFGVKFPMYEKIVVKGEGQHPLYRELIAARPTAQQNPIRHAAQDARAFRARAHGAKTLTDGARRRSFVDRDPPDRSVGGSGGTGTGASAGAEAAASRLTVSTQGRPG